MEITNRDLRAEGNIMSSPAQSRGLRKGTRDLFQTIVAVVAAGGATAVLDLIIDNVNPTYGVVMAFAFKILIAYAQNYLETAGRIPVLLPTPGIIPIAETADAVLAPVAGAVETVSDSVGEVTGTVTDTTGGVIGKVTGMVKGVINRKHDESGGIPLAAIIAIVLLVIVIAGLGFCGDALFEDEDEKNDLGMPVLVLYHEYDDEGGGDQEYDQWNNEDRNRNRNRNRGAFSPGPFDDSPVDAFNGNVICLPGSTCYSDDRNRNQPPPEGEPQ